MDSFDFRRIVNSQIGEDILYNGVSLRAVVTRNERSNVSIQGVIAKAYAYNIIIEISSILVVNGVETLRSVSDSKINGDTVVLIGIKGETRAMKVAEVIRYSALNNCYKLGLI